MAGAPVTVQGLMTRNVITIGPGAEVAQAVELLHRHHISGMPVVDAHHEVVGVVSEVDIIARRGRLVSDIMSAEPRTIDEDASLSEAAAILFQERIRRLPVVRHGKLVGLVARTDLVNFFARREWVCTGCGTTERGLEPPAACANCGAATFEQEDAPHGM
ncbi:MAG TPA: CBS domain-containing protein [Candidatus Dormibacteraeota bacterium]|nr:CBS domain-containing protein [Candidatus Dormibacteraeota bacterium]